MVPVAVRCTYCVHKGRFAEDTSSVARLQRTPQTTDGVARLPTLTQGPVSEGDLRSIVSALQHKLHQAQLETALQKSKFEAQIERKDMMLKTKELEAELASIRATQPAQRTQTTKEVMTRAFVTLRAATRP